MKAGLVGLDHPWVTGLNPATGRPIWPENVVYRTPRPADRDLASDDVVLTATGRFLAERVRQSAVTPELPVGPKRRMPHGINYIHGSSHYNSGILLFTDLAECYRHVTDRAFRREVYRFVRAENREVLFVFRQRDYYPREYAYFSCCMRTTFTWFCNPNGPRGNVLWGTATPFPAANLITGRWMDDEYALKRPGGAERVARPPIRPGTYFQRGPYDRGRDTRSGRKSCWRGRRTGGYGAAGGRAGCSSWTAAPCTPTRSTTDTPAGWPTSRWHESEVVVCSTPPSAG